MPIAFLTLMVASAPGFEWELQISDGATGEVVVHRIREAYTWQHEGFSCEAVPQAPERDGELRLQTLRVLCESADHLAATGSTCVARERGGELRGLQEGVLGFSFGLKDRQALVIVAARCLVETATPDPAGRLRAVRPEAPAAPAPAELQQREPTPTPPAPGGAPEAAPRPTGATGLWLPHAGPRWPLVSLAR